MSKKADDIKTHLKTLDTKTQEETRDNEDAI